MPALPVIPDWMNEVSHSNFGFRFGSQLGGVRVDGTHTEPFGSFRSGRP